MYAAALAKTQTQTQDDQQLLIIDDDAGIRESLRVYLEDHGYRVQTAENGAEARRLLQRQNFDLAICDIMMPGEDGLSLCRHVRATTDTPVILLTALTEDADRIVGLEIGADDYVTKPFNPRELLARIKVIMRRLYDLPARQARTKATEFYAFDRWRLHTGQRELVNDAGVVLPLSTREFSLLYIFVERQGIVLTRRELLQATRGGLGEPDDRTVDNQVSRLRRKIETDPKSPRIIKTVWGGGYQFAAPVQRL